MPHNEVDKIQRDHAKHLRRTMTRAETLLWRHLKANRLAGFGFRRQSPMGNYIADFVAHSSKLVVEVDGESHNFESIRQAAEQAAPPSLTLPRKGGGNRSVDGPRQDVSDPEGKP
jgi:very-short-patch-repair endonuclease